jgi:eukaryotic-like serine/threonine-protein kinase
MSDGKRDATHADHSAPTLPASARALSGSPVELGPGFVIGSYVLEELRSEGGFARVYRARRKADGLPVAIKVLHAHLAASPELLARFALEAETLRTIRHPNIVEVVDVGEVIAGYPYIVMEWLDAPTLGEELRRRGPFALAEVVAVIRELCAALGAAHAAGVVHRDVKASNVMVLPRGDWLTVKLVDFGIAKLVDPRDPARKGLTATGALIGTPHNMAPEQVLGQRVDRRADVYALGILICQLLTGRPPFDAATPIEIEEMHLAAPPPRLSDIAAVPTAIDEVIARCLAKTRDDRYEDVATLLAELERAAVDERPSAGPPKRAAGGREEAVAVFVRVDAELPDEGVDDAALDDIERIEDLVRRAAIRAGFEVVDEGMGRQLAVRTDRGGDTTPSADRAALGEAGICLGLDLHDAIANRSAPHPAVYAAIAIHCGGVVRMPAAGGGKREIIGGDLVGAGAWKTASRLGAVHGTEAAVAALSPRFVVGEPEGAARLCRVSRIRCEPSEQG